MYQGLNQLIQRLQKEQLLKVKDLLGRKTIPEIQIHRKGTSQKVNVILKRINHPMPLLGEEELAQLKRSVTSKFKGQEKTLIESNFMI